MKLAKQKTVELNPKQIRALAKDAVTVASVALLALDTTYVSAHQASIRILKLLTDFDG